MLPLQLPMPLSVVPQWIVQSPLALPWPITPKRPRQPDYLRNVETRTLAADIGAGCTSASGIGHPSAFGGINQNQAQMYFLKPIGRSVYNALQTTLRQNVTNPIRGIKAANFQVSYSLSRFASTGGQQANGVASDNDLDFIVPAADNDHPGRYFGPTLLDRTHQISFGGYVDIPAGFRIGLISHFNSP
jgi:hypothetical protein